MARSDAWSTRLHHENSSHEESCFVTLTYNELFLPDSYSVNVRPLQLFFKRLRKMVKKNDPDKVIRYFACGEYGDRNFRPHFHAIIFGVDFADKRPWRVTGSGHTSFVSATLEKLWPFGHCEIGTVTAQSCAYVARYVMKKMTGDQAVEHYTRIHPLTGEQVVVEPEFLVMSKGIGRDWFERFQGDVFPSDFVIVDGAKKPIPRYYMKLLAEQTDNIRVYGNDLPLTIEEQRQAALADDVRQKRELHTAGPVSPDDTEARREVREEVALRRLEQLKRELDNDP